MRRAQDAREAGGSLCEFDSEVVTATYELGTFVTAKFVGEDCRYCHIRKRYCYCHSYKQVRQ